MFVFIVVYGYFFLMNTWSKILCFLTCSVVTYCFVMWANFYIKLLMSSAKAAMNSFDECNVSTKYPSSAVRRKYLKSNKYRILKMLNQYPHVIKSPKPKQSNAWRSYSVPNVYKNLNHKVNHLSPICLGIQKQSLVLLLILLKQFKLLIVKTMWQCLG